MNEHDEFLSIVASGLYTSLLADLVAETDRDKRRLLIDQRYYTGKLWGDCYGTLGYIPGSESVMRCWDFIDDRYYNPHYPVGAIPFVSNAAVSSGDTLTADAAPGDYVIFVWHWNFTNFTLVGTLVDNSQPGAGNYVLALATIDEAEPDIPVLTGLPSSFLELTA